MATKRGGGRRAEAGTQRNWLQLWGSSTGREAAAAGRQACGGAGDNVRRVYQDGERNRWGGLSVDHHPTPPPGRRPAPPPGRRPAAPVVAPSSAHSPAPRPSASISPTRGPSNPRWRAAAPLPSPRHSSLSRCVCPLRNARPAPPESPGRGGRRAAHCRKRRWTAGAGAPGTPPPAAATTGGAATTRGGMGGRGRARDARRPPTHCKRPPPPELVPQLGGGRVDLRRDRPAAATKRPSRAAGGCVGNGPRRRRRPQPPDSSPDRPGRPRL